MRWSDPREVLWATRWSEPRLLGIGASDCRSCGFVGGFRFRDIGIYIYVCVCVCIYAYIRMLSAFSVGRVSDYCSSDLYVIRRFTAAGFAVSSLIQRSPPLTAVMLARMWQKR